MSNSLSASTKIPTKAGSDKHKKKVTTNGYYDYKPESVFSSEDEKNPLSAIIGHENQKKEILSVIDWFKHSKEFKEKGVSIPKGIILFGEPGNGKSLFIKEIIKCCKTPVFIFQGQQDNVVEGVCETFKAAREVDHAIIVFDELDLLINKERRVIRALQENLDGVEADNDVLVLSATNYIDEIPNPLLRHGRLEKLIEIPGPTPEEAYELFKEHCSSLHLELPEDLDGEEVALSLSGISCAAVKSVVNDLILHNGFTGITSEMIDDSIYRVTDRVKATPKKYNFEVAIHEAGHAVAARAYHQFFAINRLNISGAGGEFKFEEIEKGFWPYDKVIASIKISMAGNLSQKIICGRGSRGCESDLQHARACAYNIINMCGYSSCHETLPIVREGTRRETQWKLRKMERKIEHLLKKCEKETIRYIKSHKNEINRLAALLFEKKHLKSSEILLACEGSNLNEDSASGSQVTIKTKLAHNFFRFRKD